MKTKSLLPSLLPSLLLLASFSANADVFTGLVWPHTNETFAPLGTIPGVPDTQIHIQEIGIGGDADAESGPSIFSVLGSGLDFSWAAGQSLTPATFTLAPTARVPGPSLEARGFSYFSVSQFALQGGSVDVRFESSPDGDGLYTYSADSLGTFFDDSAFPSSVRVWLRYEYVPIPEPSPLSLISVAGVFWLLVMTWKRMRN